jgi:hypothetical protein
MPVAAGSGQWQPEQTHPGASWATQSKPTEPQDALQVCKPHLDLLALAPRLLEALGASERPGDVSGMLVDVARNLARWELFEGPPHGAKNVTREVRVGSNSEVRTGNREVRLALTNGHRQPDLSGPKRAIFGSQFLSTHQPSPSYTAIAHDPVQRFIQDLRGCQNIIKQTDFAKVVVARQMKSQEIVP